jgi:O-antigen/teichoic acid export membrane protein
MLGSVLRNFTVIGAAHIADRAVTFLFIVYAARKLGPDLFGQYLLIGAYVMFFSVTFMAGLVPVAVREIVRHRDDPAVVFEQVLSLRLVLGILAYAILLLVTWLALPAATFLPLAAITGTTLVVDAFKDSFGAYHNAFERMTIPGAFQVANGILAAAAGSAALYLNLDLVTLLAIVAVINLLVTIVWHVLFYTRFQRYRIRFAFSAWKHMLVMIAPIAPVQLAAQFNRLASVIMLSLVPGPLPQDRAVGYFGPAQQVAYFPLAFLFGLRRAIVPPIAHKLHQGEPVDEAFIVALKVVVVFVSFPLLVATSLFAREILLLVFGPGYVESTLTLELLGVASALWIAAMIPESLIVSYPDHKFAPLFAGTCIPLLINLILCAILIPVYSIAGAAFAILVARGGYMIFVLRYCGALLPRGTLHLTRFAVPLATLGATFGASVLAASSIEQTALRCLAVAAIATAGMLAAGHSELDKLWRLALRRERPAA